MIEYDEPAKVASPIPMLLDTIDKQTAIVSEAVRGLADRLDKVLAPTEPAASDDKEQAPQLGGSNVATRLAQVSSQLGDLGVYVNRLTARLEL